MTRRRCVRSLNHFIHHTAWIYCFKSATAQLCKKKKKKNVWLVKSPNSTTRYLYIYCAVYTVYMFLSLSPGVPFQRIKVTHTCIATYSRPHRNPYIVYAVDFDGS